MDLKQPGQYRGYLLKWTNYLKGYQKRWFVLHNGLLSYYRNQAEMAHTCRGTVNLSSASVIGGDGCTFLIYNNGIQTFHLKASSEAEQKKWIIALNTARSLLRDTVQESNSPRVEDNRKATDDFLQNLDQRLAELKRGQDMLTRKVDELIKSTGEMEIGKEPAEIMSRSQLVKERATVFKVASLAMVKSCADFTRYTSEQALRWHRLLAWERDQRVRLEQMVEELAKQHSCLENRVRSNTSSITGTTRDSSDDDFYDAMEDSDFQNGFSVTLPMAESLGSQTVSESEFLATVDEEYESDVDSDNGELVPPSVLARRRSSQVQVRVIRKQTNKKERRTKDTTIIASALNVTPPSPIDVRPVQELRSDVIQEVAIRPSHHRRTTIRPRPNISINLWSIMKNCIGKELSKIPMPVNFSEPLSMLQRLTEDYEYSRCLDTAANLEDSLLQMAYVAAFSVSAYASTAVRTNKPFNPLHGETYECDRTDDLGWRSLAEQVSHHPPVAAFHCESNGWYSWQEFSMSSKFRGKYLQIQPQGTAHLVFRRSGHHYTWKKATLTVHNIIVGKLWIDNSGDVEIINHTTGEICHLNFKAYSYFSSEKAKRVTGVIMDKSGVVRHVLDGTWNEQLDSMPVVSNKESQGGTKPVLETGTKQILWQYNPLPPNSGTMYNMTALALQLNEPEEGVAPTDSRLRPDQRLMEEGRWDEANAVKLRLEEKQRQKRMDRQNSQGGSSNLSFDEENTTERDRDDPSYESRWFKRDVDKHTRTPTSLFTGKYWDCKAKQDWSVCPDIF